MKNIVFCLPGSFYSGTFLLSFVELISWCSSNGINPIVSQNYSSLVNHSRCKVLGANVHLGKTQKPFKGEIDYDYMMWIDSDMSFNINDFIGLLEMDKDVASGWYIQPGGFVPFIGRLDDQDFIKKGSYSYLTASYLSEKKNSFKIDMAAFGWILIKKGVFESINYPWFAPRKFELTGGISDVHSEDASCCMDIKEAGFDIWLNPNIRVGHEKYITI